MTLYSGFFNAVSGDRTYDAIQISRLFDGIISDGVLMTFGNGFVVNASSGMNISVGTGRAWFNHTWTYNDSILIKAVEQSEIVLNRIDTVVLEINSEESVRANTIKIIKGTPATNPVAPTLIRTSTVNQYPLAHLKVDAGVTTIAQGKIENKIGTTDCPFVTGIVETIDVATFLAQFEANFTIWFDAMKNQLTTDAAGNLQSQIDYIKENGQTSILEMQVFS